MSAFFVWWLVVKGNYKSVEKVFLVACVFYMSYIISGFMAKPDWRTDREGVFDPDHQLRPRVSDHGRGDRGHHHRPLDAILSAVLGGRQGPEGRRLPVRPDGRDLRFHHRQHRGLLHHPALRRDDLSGRRSRSKAAKDAALALAPLAGKYCTWLFAFGLLNASLFAASILPLSTAYTICEAFGWESSVNRKFVEAPQFYGLYSLMIFLGAGIILFPNVPLISIMYYSQVINGMLLPFILIFMLLLINDRRIMGDYVNGRFMNVATWLTVIVLIVLSGAMVVRTIIH